MLTIFKRLIFVQLMAQVAYLTFAPSSVYADQVLGTDRLMLFNEWTDGKDYGNPKADKWTHEGTLYVGGGALATRRRPLLTGSNHWHTAGWVATNVAVGSSAYISGAQYIKPQTYSNVETNFAANLFNKQGALLISPYYKDGIGTIYFDAINSLKTISGTISLEIATNMVARNNINVVKDLQEQEDATWKYNWGLLKDITLAETTGGAVTGVPVKETVNWFAPIKFRIVRKDAVAQTQPYYDQNFLVVDNIQVSYPQRGVSVDSVEIIKTRGKSLSATVSCKVSNVGEVQEEASAYTYSDNASRKVTVHYSSDGGASWNQDEMIYRSGSGDLGNEEEYSFDIELAAGQQTITYYCSVEVAGTRYFPQDFTQSNRTFWPDDGGEPGQAAQTSPKERNVSAWSTPTVVTTLGQDRILLFNTWTNGVDYGDYYGGGVTHIGKAPSNSGQQNAARRARAMLLNGSNHFYNTGWQVLNASVGTSAFLQDAYDIKTPNHIYPTNYVHVGMSVGNIVTNWQANLWNTLDAMIVTPSYESGIGTIYFDAVNVYVSGEIAVDICTNMVCNIGGARHYGEFAKEEYTDGVGDWKFNWQTVLIQELNRDLGSVVENDKFFRVKIPINYLGGIKARIRRNKVSTDGRFGYLDDALIAIDNIQISEPAANVAVEVDEVPFNPAYPSLNDEISVRCRVSNVQGVPATDNESRGVEVWWRWRYGEQIATPWAPTQMDYVANTEGDDGKGNGELYEGRLPKQENIGDIEYYFVCNFDGRRYQPFDYALLDYKFWDNSDNSESFSPAMCRKGDPEKGERDFFARLRRYKSDLGAMYLYTDLQPLPIEMELIDNDVWRGMVPVYKWVKTHENFTAYFVGTNTYRVGTDSSGRATYTIDDSARYWNEAESYAAVPTGGICVETEEEPYIDIMKFQIPQSGYVSLTLDLNDNSYKARRAEYQDFNEWQAWDAFFASTFYNRDAQAYRDDIDGNGEEGNTGWDETMPDTQDEYFRVASSNLWMDAVYSDYIVTDRKTFEMANASYVGELSQVDSENSPFGDNSPNNKFYPNVAARLIGVDHLAINEDNLVALGSLYTLESTVIDGLQSFSFKARAAEIGNLDRIASYDLSSYKASSGLVLHLDETNYTATVTADIMDESPEEHSISVVAFKKRKSFYELRLTQCAPKKVDSPRQGGQPVIAPYYRLDLYRWNNGVATHLATDRKAGDEYKKLDISAAPAILKLTANNDGEKTVLNGAFYVGTTSQQTVTFSDADSARLKSGDFGFWSENCRVKVTQTAILDHANPNGAEVVLPLESENWDYDPEFFEGVSASAFLTAKPSNKIAVYIQDADVEHKADPADRKWVLHKEFDVLTYKYMAYTLNFDSWKAKHVKIQNLGVADIAIDEIHMVGFHAQNVGGNTYDWDGTEVWVENVGDDHGKVVTLDLTRADNAAEGGVAAGERQAVRAPYMDWGRASFAFDYQVTTYPVLLALQIADDEYGPWETLGYYPQTNSLITGWNNFYEYIGNTNSGCMRIVNVMTNGFVDADGKTWDFTNGVVRLDNFVAWDNPVPTNSVAWKTYNGRITQSNPGILTLDGSKVLVLNNSVESDVYDGYAPMNLSKPYLKTPALSTGIGEIRLEARLFDDSKESATLKVYGLVNDEWTTDGMNWERIAMLDVTNIASQYYTVFSHDGQSIPGVDPERYKAIKFESEYDGSQPRICIENVSITEPLYPGFEINSVKLLYHTNSGEYGYRDQPLVTDLVGVEAKLTNLRLNPQDIKVYLSYYVGTNVWGVNKIWGEKSQWKPTQRNTVQLEPYGDPANYTFRTPFDNDIPFQEENAVVQYVVWATYTSEDGGMRYTTLQSETSFKNPDWYYPTDLNALYGGWSPYYIVYRVPRGAVFFNELNFQERPSLITGTDFAAYYNSFIELAIPADTDMTGWRVELINADLEQQMAVRLVTEARGKPEVTNGYAFLVIADSADEQEYNTGTTLPNVDIFKPGLNGSFLDARDPGGLRLKRPLGMYEQAITFDRYGDVDNSIVDAGTGEPFTYVGTDIQYASLSVTNGTGEAINDWATISWRENSYLPDYTVVVGDDVKVWTPGEPNMFQIMPIAPEIFAGMSNVVVMAYITPSTKGLQNGVSGRLAFKMAKTDTTNIVYDTHNWYHITSVKLIDDKTGAVKECVGTDMFRENNSTNYTLTLANLPNAVTIQATITPDDRFNDPSLPYTVREWLQGYPESEVSKHKSYLVPWGWEAPNRSLSSVYPQDEIRELSFVELYWLNCEPVRDNVLYHGLGSVEAPARNPLNPAETNVYINVKMRLEHNADDGSGRVVTNKLTTLRGSTVDVDIPAFKIKAATPDMLSSRKWHKVSQYTFDEATFDDDYNCRIKLNVGYPFFDGETTLLDSGSWTFRYIIEYEDGAFSRPVLQNNPSSNP